MRPRVFLKNNLSYNLEQLKADQELCLYVQDFLIQNNFLKPSADGGFGKNSQAALIKFKEKKNIKDREFLSSETMEALYNLRWGALKEKALKLSDNFASKIVKYSLNKDYELYEGERIYNIVYVEGVNVDGTPNTDTPNEWNDRRIILQILNGVPKIIGNWAATCEPGKFYTENRMNPKGAARISFGQYKAWVHGKHGTSKPHKALVQQYPIEVYRDDNEDYIRKGDKTDKGIFHVNQHWGFGLKKVDESSAGCFTAPDWKGHLEFLDFNFSDRRYEKDNGFVYPTIIIPGDELN